MPRSPSSKKCSLGVRSRSPNAVGRCYKKGTKIFKNTGYKMCNYPTGCSPKLKNLGQGKPSSKKKSRSPSPVNFYTFPNLPQVGKRNPSGECLPMSSKQLKKGKKVEYCQYKPKHFDFGSKKIETQYNVNVNEVEEIIEKSKKIFKEFNRIASEINDKK